MEKVEKAIKIVKAEKRMREYVFRNNPEKKAEKVKEMDLVIEVLEEYKLTITPAKLF